MLMEIDSYNTVAVGGCHIALEDKWPTRREH